MKPERWKQIDELYQVALKQEPNRRMAFLLEACGADSDLLREVGSLLVSHEQGQDVGQGSATEAPSRQPMPSLVGQQLGHYQVLSLLGRGGMGEVYRARDTRLDRIDALKILPVEMAAEPDRLRRFVREAKAASALNHPHIATIYEIGEAEGIHYIAMELVEGQTLAQRIHGHPLELRELLNIGLQVTEALEEAHSQGITHRDIKPGNIMLTKRNQVKVLDFGLAKRQAVKGAVGRSSAATESESLTGTGMILGTLEYMAPEQVEGKEADARTDIFALGAVIYEMATGRKAFEGKSQASLMAAILTSEPPPMTGLQPLTPPALEHAVERCLAKDPNERWQRAHDIGSELKWIAEGQPRVKLSRRWGWAMVVGLGLLVTAALGTLWWMRKPEGPSSPPVLRRITWDTGLTTDPTLSPDGKLLAYASDRSGEGNLDIWVQQLVGGEARGEPHRLTRDPADDYEPTFSPDGSSIAFSSTRKGGGIHLIPASGGQERLLTKLGHRPRFSPDGRWIAYWVGKSMEEEVASKSFILPLSGGTARQLQPDFHIVASPTWSPDGRHILFWGWKQSETVEEADWWVTPVEGGPPTRTDIRQWPGSKGMYLPKWTNQRTLVIPEMGQDNADIWQISISPKTFQVNGSPQRLTSGTAQQIQPSVAAGYLACSSVTESGNIWALPVDHTQGKALGEIQALTQDTSINALPSISADGTRLVYTSRRSGRRTGLIKELNSGRVTPFLPESPERSSLYRPKVSRDGSMVAYYVYLRNKRTVYVANTDDLTSRLLCENCGFPSDWFPDGHRLLLFSPTGRWTQIDSIDVNSSKRSLAIQYSGDLIAPHISPDGHWIALHTDISATQIRIMVVPLHNGVAAGEKEWVSITDGSGFDLDANWSPDGNLLYFFSERDGFRCIWGQRLDPTSKTPLGSPFPVYHSHDPRRSLRNVWLANLCMSVSSSQIVFPMGELTGNIWITEYRHQP